MSVYVKVIRITPTYLTYYCTDENNLFAEMCKNVSVCSKASSSVSNALFLALQALSTDLRSAAFSSLSMALKLLIACFLVPLLAIC